MKSKPSLRSASFAYELFDLLFENKTFSWLIFACAILGAVISLSFTWGSFVPVLDDFKVADLYKISLFVAGISPYSREAWAAPYPPFYFMVWSVPYIFFSNLLHFSLNETYFGIRVLSTILASLCSYVIYSILRANARFSREKSLSLASLFLLCSLTGLIGMTGDFFGLLFFSLACYFLAKGKNLAGLALVALAVAFKIQPVLGLVILLTSLCVRAASKKEIASFVATVAGAGMVLGLVPILLIPDAISSFLLYSATNLQYYSFNIYAGLADVLANLFSFGNPTTNVLTGVNVAWVILSVTLGGLVIRKLLKDNLLRFANPLDILSLGVMLWLIVLKQTMPHYFLWALIPLLANGRNRSLVMVLAGEFFGMLSFGISYVLSVDVFGIKIVYPVIPNLDISIVFLIGGALFAFFMALGVYDLLRQMKKEIVEHEVAEKVPMTQMHS